LRRPVIFLFLFYALGIALGHYQTPEPFYFFIFAALLTAGYFISRILRLPKEQITPACLFLSVALLGCISFYLADHNRDPLESCEGESSVAEGRIVTVQIRDDSRWQMLITAENGRKRLVQVAGAMDDPAEWIGKWAVARGTVMIPAERRNPGLFDYRLYLKTRGVRVILQSSTEQISLDRERSSFLFTRIAEVKYGFLDKLEKEMNPEAYGLIIGMLFGDCSLISEDTYEAFQKNGVAHILSVSGIHVGIVYLCVSRLLGNRKTRFFYLLTAMMLVFYAALSEFSPSVVRAVTMIFIHMISKVSYRRYDFMACTSASALGMLIINPFYLFNAGFQLSYMAVFCLAAALPWGNRKIGQLEEAGKSELLTEGLRVLSPLLIIQTGMAPLTAYLFNYFSIVSFLVNIPVIAISGIIIPLGIVLIPISFFGGIFFGVGARAAEILADLMLNLNSLFYLPGVGSFLAVSPPVFLLLVFYGFFFFLTSEYLRILYQRRRKNTILLCCILILALSVPASVQAAGDSCDADLVFVDVGQGDCLHIRTPGGKNILIDGGGSVNYEVGKKTLLPYLLKNGVSSIDLAVVTHLHTDHYRGIAELARNMKIKRLALYEANFLREKEILAEMGLRKQDLLYLARGDRISLDRDIWIDVLYPEAKPAEEYRAMVLDEKDENGSCLFMKVSYYGFTVEMTGDIGVEGERKIMELHRKDPEILHADVLKIGHHGSRYSTGDAFLEAVKPKIAVFQVGKNNFGHPHPAVIDKCLKKGIMVYRNDSNGAIIFHREGQLWRIKVLLGRNMHIKE